MLWLVAVALVALAGAGILLALVQRSALFPVHLLPNGGPSPPPGTVVTQLDADGDAVEAWLLPAADGRPDPAPLLLFAHGNGELIDFWPPAFDGLRRWGCAVLLVEFPGYGRSEGRPSRSSIARAMIAAWEWAAARPEIDRERIVGYGRSVGGGAVCDLSRARPLAALVLESTFTSAREMAWRFGLPGFLVRDPFDNRAALAAFPGPVLIVHGDRDEIVPLAHAEALAGVTPRAELHVLHGGHNDLPRPWPEVERFLRARGLLERRAYHSEDGGLR